MPEHAEDVTAKDYERAIAEVFGWYPYDVFPADSTTADGLAAAMARRTCINIMDEAGRQRAARIDGSEAP